MAAGLVLALAVGPCRTRRLPRILSPSSIIRRLSFYQNRPC